MVPTGTFCVVHFSLEVVLEHVSACHVLTLLAIRERLVEGFLLIFGPPNSVHFHGPSSDIPDRSNGGTFWPQAIGCLLAWPS